MLINSIPRPPKFNSGTSLLEVLVCVVVIGIVALVGIGWYRRLFVQSSRINCVNNLKNIALGFRTFTVDYNGEYPWQIDTTNGGIILPPVGVQAGVSNNVLQIFACISNELSTPKIMRCSNDRRPNPTTNSWAYVLATGAKGAEFPSYFIGTDASEIDPSSFLSGDRNLLISNAGLDYKTARNYNRITPISNTEILKATGNGLGWTSDLHNRKGNLLFGDGSVQRNIGPADLRTHLLRATTNNTAAMHLFLPALER